MYIVLFFFSDKELGMRDIRKVGPLFPVPP